MSKRYKIKTILLALMFMLLAVAGVLVYKYWPRTLPPEQCSEVYRRYCDRDDLKVAFVKDYRIGDSITVDVTTITAKDSAGWESLLREMNVSEIIISKQRESIKKNTIGVHIYYCRKGHPEKKVLVNKSQYFNIVTDSPQDKIVYVFDIINIEQGSSIICEKISELIQTNLWNNQSK